MQSDVHFSNFNILCQEKSLCEWHYAANIVVASSNCFLCLAKAMPRVQRRLVEDDIEDSSEDEGAKELRRSSRKVRDGVSCIIIIVIVLQQYYKNSRMSALNILKGILPPPTPPLPFVYFCQEYMYSLWWCTTLLQVRSAPRNLFQELDSAQAQISDGDNHDDETDE